MGLIIFWIGVNAVIGYLIGQKKNDVGSAIALSIILGPIGWFIALVSHGNWRKCPFCSEDIRPEALVCRYCGRDIPKIVRPAPPPSRPYTRKEKISIAVVLTLFVVICLVASLISPTAPSANEKEKNVTSSLFSDDFHAERQTLYVRIISPSTATTVKGRVHLHPGNIVLVTARNSKSLRVNLDGYEAVIPISVTELAKQSK